MQRMLWVTTARPHVDRCGTAWLITRFIDKAATFAFIQPNDEVPKGGTPFDLPGVEYGHQGDACTFEVAVQKHGLDKDEALARVAQLVHDVDFHKMKLPESAGLDAILYGLKLTEPDDHRVLENSYIVFDSLYARAKAKKPQRVG